MKCLVSALTFIALVACIPVPVVVPIGNPDQPVRQVQRLAATAPANPEFDAVFTQIRRNAGLSPLISNATLDRIATAHAVDMVAGGYLGHRDRAGRNATDRVRNSGASTCGAGENLARGQTNAVDVATSWMASGGHRANMLNPAVRELWFWTGR